MISGYSYILPPSLTPCVVQCFNAVCRPLTEILDTTTDHRANMTCTLAELWLCIGHESIPINQQRINRTMRNLDGPKDHGEDGLATVRFQPSIRSPPLDALCIVRSRTVMSPPYTILHISCCNILGPPSCFRKAHLCRLTATRQPGPDTLLERKTATH